MIEWLRRVDPSRPFLTAEGRSWNYGRVLEAVESRMVDAPRLIRPSLTPESVFEIIAGISGGGATVVGPGSEVSEPGDADLVVFTSGSTGRPKGVRLTNDNLAAAAAASAEHLGHGAEDDWLLAMPLHHVGGISIIVRQAYTGGSITMLREFDPATFADAMHQRVTMVSVVPTMLARLLGFGPFTGLRAVLVGGGPIPPRLLEGAAETGLPVLPTYGMTETFGQVATLRPGSPLAYETHPLPGIDLRIEPNGRIAVRGRQVSPGYLGRPDRPDPWFVTSDIGEIDDRGALRIVGRADSVIVTGGENVSPERVEAVVVGHPGVTEAVVVGIPDLEWGQTVGCVYVGDVEDIAEWVGARLPSFMVPKRWKAVAAIPRVSIDKPDREAARALLQ